RAGRCGAHAREDGALRAAGAAPEGRHGEVGSRIGGGPARPGSAVMAAKILVVADHAGGRLAQATAKAVSCALQVPEAEVHVAVFAADAAPADAAARLAGVRKVLLVQDARHE